MNNKAFMYIVSNNKTGLSFLGKNKHYQYSFIGESILFNYESIFTKKVSQIGSPSIHSSWVGFNVSYIGNIRFMDMLTRNSTLSKIGKIDE